MQPVQIQCPYCFEVLTIWLAYDDVGEMFYDCTVCCHPWSLRVWLNEMGDIRATAHSSD
ncbi:MAG: CPXCG motif-containing cysteine-rich protein [Myxococcota bacterium]|nr:CPXCG motif-containing cysteine-rich protein [Myxococcota bacterium]